MKTYNLYTNYKKILTDTITPVTVYYKIRDKFPNSILLESGDYHQNQKNFSYICCNPIASFKVENEIISQTFPDGSSTELHMSQSIDIVEEISNFTKRFNHLLFSSLAYILKFSLYCWYFRLNLHTRFNSYFRISK